jgi:hypothetical protein
VAPLDTLAVRGVVESEAFLALSDLRLWGIWNCRRRGLKEAEGSNLLGKGDDPASEGWIVFIRVLGRGDLNRGDAGLDLHLLAYLVFRDCDTVPFEISKRGRHLVDHVL